MPEFDTVKGDHRTVVPPTLARLLTDYRVPAGHFDELLDPAGAARPHWAQFFAAAGELGPGTLTRAHERITRQLHDNGVTYNVHATGGAPRDWTLDVLPHVMPSREWEPLASGLRQRARLLDAIAADLYGDQQLLTAGLIPPAVVYGHPRFLRACHGVRPPGGTLLHVVAFDVTRGPDGQWRVMATRCQAPSGAGYALENRLTVSRVFPDAFREQRVRLLAPFFRTLQETMVQGSPRESGAPHIVLLTPGPYNETYFEHAYLSRYLGFTLAEGADLTVRDDRVWLKTVTGLQPVNGILRRLDDDFSDPLELRSDSTLGVPGLVQAWRAGNVLVANAFGTGVVESSALNPYLPAVCQHLLGEDLAVPSPGSWWCGDRSTAGAALDQLPAMTIKSAFGGYETPAVFGRDLDAGARASWVERISASPSQYVLESYVPLSHVPVWHERTLQSRALMMRVFLVADGQGDYGVLPGALTRIAGSEGQLVSGQRGGGSKDTWVLSDAPVERFSLLPGRLKLEDIARSERMVSSRAGEHLFWMGRYLERSENGARLLRAVLTRLHQGQPLVSSGSRPIVDTCERHGLLPEGDAGDEAAEWRSTHDLEAALIASLFDARAVHGVSFNVGQAVRVAGTVRDRLSTDNWRVLTQLSEALARRPSGTPGLAEALDLIDRTILSLVAVGGLEMAHMTRDDGWRFMSLGRHLERLVYVSTTVGAVARSESVDDAALLEWLLDLSDSIITYRARYMGHAEWLAVADLLLFDGRNPRSAAFQLAKLAKHVALLPGADLGALVRRIERIAATRAADPDSLDLFQPSDRLTPFLDSCEQVALTLSDALTLRYFSHVYEPAHATLLELSAAAGRRALAANTLMPTYRVQHETRYAYGSTVATSQHVACLTPRRLPFQHLHSSELTIDPPPARVTQRIDYFGNLVAQFQLLRPHTELSVVGHSLVEVGERWPAGLPEDGTPWEDVRETIADAAANGGATGSAAGDVARDVVRDVSQFLFPSPYVPPSAEIEAFARASFPAGRSMLSGAIDLMHRIYDGFSFDPSATNVTTPVTRVLAERRGVCQDFAHFQISCLRSLGLPARYVSGYLLTDPPPGQARLVGADASHAWVSVYSPGQGWVDLDPTNDVVVSTRHVTVAWGRDYGDVSPLRGILLGGSEHTLTVAVSVTPE